MKKSDIEELKELNEKAQLHSQNVLKYFREARHMQRRSTKAANSIEQLELINRLYLKNKQAIEELHKITEIQTKIIAKQRNASQAAMESL
jgi:hypothetical protein